MAGAVDVCQVSLMAESLEPEESFLEACARNGFGTLSKSTLVELCNYVEVDVTCETSFAVLHEFLSSIFPGATEHEILILDDLGYNASAQWMHDYAWNSHVEQGGEPPLWFLDMIFRTRFCMFASG